MVKADYYSYKNILRSYHREVVIHSIYQIHCDSVLRLFALDRSDRTAATRQSDAERGFAIRLLCPLPAAHAVLLVVWLHFISFSFHLLLITKSSNAFSCCG